MLFSFQSLEKMCHREFLFGKKETRPESLIEAVYCPAIAPDLIIIVNLFVMK